MAEAEDELVQQNQLVKELISDLERRSEWSTTQLLQVRTAQSEVLETQSKLFSLLYPRALILVLRLRGSFGPVEPLFALFARRFKFLSIKL